MLLEVISHIIMRQEVGFVSPVTGGEVGGSLNESDQNLTGLSRVSDSINVVEDGTSGNLGGDKSGVWLGIVGRKDVLGAGSW